MTAPSADRTPRRGNWFSRLPWPGKAKPRLESPAWVDHGLWTVDRAVRVLATSCHREQRGVPVAHAVVVGADTITLHLKTPDEPAPAGWTTTDGGRTWQAQLRWIQSAPVAEELPDPYPRLVPLGVGSEGFVLLNLGQAGGVIGLEGDGRQARALARDWVHDLATGPWSRGVRVVRVGFGDDPSGLGTVTDVAAFRDAETALANEAGGVLVLAGMPGGREWERVHALAEDPAGRWSVVIVGRVDSPRWRFTVDAAGLVDTGLFSGPLAHRPEAVGRVTARTLSTTPTAAAQPGDARQTRPLYARPRFVAATASLALLLGAGLTVSLVDFSSPDTPAANSAGNQTTLVEPTSSSPHSSPESSSPSAEPSVSSPEAEPTSTPPAQSAPTPPVQNATPPPPPKKTAPPPAQTKAAGSGRQLVNPATGKCLTALAGSDGTPLTLELCVDAPNQVWDVINGTLRTKGLCMDAAWGNTSPGTVVQIAYCNGTPAQHFSRRGDTLYGQQSGLCATVVNGGAGTQLQPCKNSRTQIFRWG